MGKNSPASTSTLPVATSTLPVATLNNVRVYNITGNAHKALPDWLVRRSARSLKKDAEWRRRVELIQDLEFPEASLQSKFTRDGRHLVATGTYKPQFRVYELAEMSMKFDRHTDAETVSFEILSEDWTKLALLQANRTVEFHGPSGVHHRVKIPRAGRCMMYDPFSCDLVIGASDAAVYRLNLDRGQYLAPFDTDSGTDGGVNAVARAPLHGLYALACQSGAVEFWDRRDRRCVGALRMLADSAFSPEATALAFLPDGMHWAAGTSTGQVTLFDLRSTRPLLTRDHHYGFPIRGIHHHTASDQMASYDKKAVRIWNRASGALLTTVEASGGADINHVNMRPDDGFLLCSVEDRQMQSFYIPALGPAPRWASFLENLTEEMEEGNAPGAGASAHGAVYDNYKFVTRSELNALNLDHLVGSNVLRAYMHGFFVDLRLYEKAKSISNPFAYEEYLAEQRRAKLEAERVGRIKANSSAASKGVKTPRVNAVLAERLQKQSELLDRLDALDRVDALDAPDTPATKTDKKALQTAKSSQAILQDTRFTALFTNPDFAIDVDRGV